jgi:4-hydroxy-3-methylbut-2-enyl diphosphate reductase
VEILLAKEMGFCWGVRRAISMMEKAASERGQVISLGPIVHNPQVVATLAEKGVQVTSSIDGVSGVPLAIAAHGVGPKVLEEAKAKGLDIIDTTCPIVSRSQRWAKKMAEDGFTVIVYSCTSAWLRSANCEWSTRCAMSPLASRRRPESWLRRSN